LTVRAETKGLRAVIAIADNVPDSLIGDPVRLRAALENLLDNAVKFTDQGAVELELRAEPAQAGRVRLHCIVRDSGIGLTRAETKRLFRPFAQASVEIAQRYGGAGLGLSVVKMLAKRMGGDLTVTSTPGRGSVFQFTAVLPIARDEAVAAALASQRR
jgi:signal transduction histidine kinase